VTAPAVRDDLATLEPYDPDMRPVEVMLSANENAYGLPTAVRAAIAERVARLDVHRYPEATSPRLRELLGELCGVPARNVAVGNGGDELIFNLLLAYGGAGRRAVVCPPTFSAYALYAQLTATSVVEVPRTRDFDLDEDALLAAARGAALVFVTSPNNPTGNLADPAFVERLARQTEALVVVDEAYADFAAPEASCLSLVSELPNVCVLKTLSKAYALAGARLGFVAAPDAVVDALLAVRQPYSVSRFDQAAAETVLEMRDAVEPQIAALVAGRGELEHALGDLGRELADAWGRPVLELWPSQANFLLVRVGGERGVPSAHELHDRLARERSILVRDFSSVPGLAGCLRVTVGTPRENELLVAALRDLLTPDAAPSAPKEG
jgi:histidinol-phosphate aminotransferase